MLTAAPVHAGDRTGESSSSAPASPAAGSAPVSAPAGGGEQVIIVDLRGDAGRDPFAAALARSGELAPRQDEGLAAALAGGRASDHASGRGSDHGSGHGNDQALSMTAASAALDRARSAYGDLDCEAARRQARVAVDELAALQAAGAAVTPALQRAHVYELLCAHDAGQVDAAMAAAFWLQRLDGTAAPPPGVSQDLWRSYLPLDATASAHIVELVVDTEPPGAAVWLDHRQVGIAPVRVLAREGEHILAAATRDTAQVAQRIQVSAVGLDRTMTRAVTLRVVARERPWAVQAARVAGWREQAGSMNGAGLGALMAELGVRIALVLPADKRRGGPHARAGSGTDRGEGAGKGAVEIWALDPGQTVARRLGQGRTSAPADVVAQVMDQVRRWDGGASGVAGLAGLAGSSVPDGAQVSLQESRPLLREGDVAPRTGQRSARGVGAGRKTWWVYATIIGAVVAGGLVIASQDLADDRQRIELRWP